MTLLFSNLIRIAVQTRVYWTYICSLLLQDCLQMPFHRSQKHALNDPYMPLARTALMATLSMDVSDLDAIWARQIVTPEDCGTCPPLQGACLWWTTAAHQQHQVLHVAQTAQILASDAHRPCQLAFIDIRSNTWALQQLMSSAIFHRYSPDEGIGLSLPSLVSLWHSNLPHISDDLHGQRWQNWGLLSTSRSAASTFLYSCWLCLRGAL